MRTSTRLPSTRVHPDGFTMYHAAKDYVSGNAVLVQKENGDLLHFTYNQWIKFPKVRIR